MTVSITFQYPRELSQNATIIKQLWNVAYFIRDMWLARSPYGGGDYAKGLVHSGSVKVGQGRIVIENFSKHSQVVEYGHRSYNIGLIMLQRGRGVKTSLEGNKYKRVKIKPKPTAAYRKESVAQGVIQTFKRAAPIGMKIPRIDRYGMGGTYKPRRALQRPIKPGKMKPGAPRGVFTISEKAIREDPHKWLVPKLEGKFLAKKIQKEAKPFVIEAMRQAMKMERDRQLRQKGKNPKWYRPERMTQVLRFIPEEKK